MQPQRREVRVENDEYESEQQRLAKQIKRVVVLRNDHILTRSVRFETALTSSKLFQRSTYALPSFSHFSHFVDDSPMHMPRLLTNPHVLVHRSLRCARGIHCEYVHLVL